MEAHNAVKWTVTMKANTGNARMTKKVDVFAVDQGEARVTAKDVAEDKGWSKVLIKSAIKN